LVIGLTGCAGVEPLFVGNSRPAIYPRPADVQEEKRDARFFLAYPDESIGPPLDMLPREAD
jgi:hypothetical protein